MIAHFHFKSSFPEILCIPPHLRANSPGVSGHMDPGPWLGWLRGLDAWNQRRNKVLGIKPGLPRFLTSSVPGPESFMTADLPCLSWEDLLPRTSHIAIITNQISKLKIAPPFWLATDTQWLDVINYFIVNKSILPYIFGNYQHLIDFIVIKARYHDIFVYSILLTYWIISRI